MAATIYSDWAYKHIPLGGKAVLRAGVLKRTLSHICLRLNLLMFLFKVGLFTLMQIDSLINLDRS